MVIPGTINSIGYDAFYECTNLTSVNISEGVTSIDYWAFRGCTQLSVVSIPDSLTNVDPTIFEDCTSLSGSSYDNAVYVGNNSNPYIYLLKASSTSISSVTIHSSTKAIGSKAFKNCTELTSIEITNDVIF